MHKASHCPVHACTKQGYVIVTDCLSIDSVCVCALVAGMKTREMVMKETSMMVMLLLLLLIVIIDDDIHRCSCVTINGVTPIGTVFLYGWG